jgi:thermitase
MFLRVAVSGLLVGGILGAGSPAMADSPSVSLVVGLRSDAAESAVVGKLDRAVEVRGSESLGGAVAVDVPAGDATEAQNALRADPSVAYVEPNHIATIDATTPNDPAYKQQWGLTKTGVNTAWDTTKGSGTVTVAVVDTGVSPLPDLNGRLLQGYDFVNNDSNAADDNGHGTMAAGVIAASGNNGIGVAGLCWYCRILPVKVLNAKGSGDYGAIAKGIRYAADQGAEIINLSLGGTQSSQLLTDAVNYATDKGALVIAAAGNSGSSKPHYPAAVPAALAVGGSDSGDNRYSWSNYGSSWVDLAAPGCNIAQTRTGALGNFCGTSSATPFVAGVAALIASTSPTPAANAIRTTLISTADKISGGWVASSSGRVNAAKALDLGTVLLTSDTVAPTMAITSPASGAVVRGTVTVGGTATDDQGVAKVELLANGKRVSVDRNAPYAFSWNTSAIRTGTVTLTMRAYDRGGNVTTATRTVRVDNAGPSIKVTAPASGTKRVRGTQYVTTSATDPMGVRSVQLLVNGKVSASWAGSARRFPVVTTRYGTTIRVQVRSYDRLGNGAVSQLRTWSR